MYGVVQSGLGRRRIRTYVCRWARNAGCSGLGAGVDVDVDVDVGRGEGSAVRER